MKASIKTVLLTILLASQAVFAKEYSPYALKKVIDQAIQVVQMGRRPVVVFDLDDTLTNTRERNLRILRDFASQPEIASAYFDEAKKIDNLTVDQIQYLLGDTMKGLGISDQIFIQKATDFWLAHFFTNEYCAKDKANPGAARYLHLLARAGARIVYLTGRDTPRMGEGTGEDLIRNRFPMNQDQAQLIMKPDAQMDDLKFKESQYEALAAMGEVIGVFENEPANINSMADAFPNAEAIFLDTIHSPKPIVPEDRVEWVRDFRF